MKPAPTTPTFLSETAPTPFGRRAPLLVYEGLQLPMDLALKVESRYFAKILRSPEAAAMIRPRARHWPRHRRYPPP
jgi:hypothetical protein